MSSSKLSRDIGQESAISTRSNAVVTAGAGAGKTRVLTERYLSIIKSGEAGVEGILALTFTRKAAAEMMERIYSEMLKASPGSPEIRREMDRFNLASISTLDSFCSQVVKSGGRAFGVRSEFRVEDERSSKLLLRDFIPDFILRYQNHPGCKQLVSLYGYTRTVEEVFIPLCQDFFEIGVDFNARETLQLQLSTSETLLRDAIDSMHQIAVMLTEMPPARLQSLVAYQNWAEGFVNHIAEFGAPETRQEREACTQFAVQLKALGAPRGTGEDSLFIKDLVSGRDKLSGMVINANATLDFLSTADSLFELLEAFGREFIDARRESGILSFRDISSLAVRILASDPELCRYYRKKYRFIMIDEFQDNNQLQKDLLYLLAAREEVSGIPTVDDLHPGKLFFVGDEKQSIYRFRGADVRVFKGLQDELTSHGGEAITLSTNYRSDPALLTRFNDWFSRIMRLSGNPSEAMFSPLSPPSFASPSPESLFRLGVYIPDPSGSAADGDDDGEDEEAQRSQIEAAWLIGQIQFWVEGEQPLTVRNGDGGRRKLEYGDVAILFRSTGNQKDYETQCRLRGIPYENQATRSLFLEAPVNDIHALIRLCLFPEDRLAYATVLRSPFCCVSDDGLVTVINASRIPFSPADSWDDGDLAAGLDESDRANYDHAREIYGDVCALADQVSIRELLRRIWFHWGYRFHLLSRPGNHGFLDHYDHLCAIADTLDSAGGTLVEFLSEIERYLGSYERSEVANVLAEEGSGIHFMTIHKSKGLEFPLVCLAETGSTPKGTVNSPLMLSPAFGPVFRPEAGENVLYSRARDDAAAADEAERKRLLYVALTRAEDHLVVSGSIKAKKSADRMKADDKSLLELMISGLGWESSPDSWDDPCLCRIEPVSRIEATRSRVDAARPPSLTEAQNTYGALAPIRIREEIPDILPSRHDEAPGETTGPVSMEVAPVLPCDAIISSHKLETAFGSLCHSCVELRIRTGSFPEPGMIPDRVMAAIPREVRDQLLAQAIDLAGVFFSSAEAAGLLSSSVEPEVPFLARIGDSHTVKGVIDLLCVDESGFTIVDFKTDRFINPDAYRTQLSYYHHAARNLTGRETGRTLLFYLRFGRFVPVQPCDEQELLELNAAMTYDGSTGE